MGLLPGLLLVAGCRSDPLAALEPSVAAREPAPAGPVRLADVAASAGVRFRHEFGSQYPLPIVETMGSGAAFLDYDGDGRLDLFLVSSGQDFRRPRQRPGCRLFRNEGQGRFTDVTEEAGIGVDSYAMGCCVGDYDNDGHVDMLVTGYGRDTLLHNEAGSRSRRVFRDVTRAAGLRKRAGGWGTGCSFVDLDLDGWLDLYVANYVRYNPALPLCPTAHVMSGCTPGHYDTQPNELYMNNRDGTFREQAKALGADDPGGAGLGVVAADFDNDGDPDLFVANDGTPNALFQNRTITTPGYAHRSGDGDGDDFTTETRRHGEVHGERRGSGNCLSTPCTSPCLRVSVVNPFPARRFRNIGLASGVAYSESGSMRAGMGTDAGDVDGDGRFDLVITNFQHEPNSLYRNAGSQSFEEITDSSGIGPPGVLKLGFGVAFLDVDGDGQLDLYVGNGHVFDNVAEFDDTATYAQTDQLFWNRGGGRLLEISQSAGPALAEPGVTRGIAVGDFDDNGTPDLLINRSGQAARLLAIERLRSSSWIGFWLRGTRSNRSAIGARVEVRTTSGAGGEGALQVREVRSGSSYLSQHDLRPLFGLGSVTGPGQVRVTIRWPSGVRQTVPLPGLNRYVLVEEPRE